MTAQRKNPQLLQTYLIWDELVRMRVRHTNRYKSILRGDSNLDIEIEKTVLAMPYLSDNHLNEKKKEMAAWAEAAQPEVWDWLMSIKGIGLSLGGQIMAHIDDITKFDNVSQLWRASGLAVFDGQAERNKKGEKSHFNKRLKSVLTELLSAQFLRAQTPLYVDLYYQHKERYRNIYPEPIVVNGVSRYTDLHIHRMARRKMIKVFVQHLWLVWRTAEGLSVNNPYIHDIGGHSKLIPPPNWG